MKYADKRKQHGSDNYGSWREGRLITAETIAGTTISAQLKGNR